MKVLYIHQYFVLPQEPGGTRSYWISRELVKRGHEVVMVTGTNKNHPEAEEIDVDGIHVIYVKNAYSNYMSSMERIKSFMRFVWKAIKVSRKQKGVDMVFATSTPLTVGVVALWLKFTKCWKYVFEVRDLWPEALILEGGINNGFIKWGLRLLEKWSYKFSAHVIALSPGMQEGVLKVGTPSEKCTMVPNMSKPDRFYPREANREVAKQFNIDLNKFNVIHFGSMGICNGLGYIIEAAKLAQEQGSDDLNFVFLGDGATLPELQRLTELYQLNNVQFLGNHKMDVVSEIVNCCDASITSFSNIPILATNSPNKLFDSLSAGKPIIVNSAGWTKDMVEKDDCGFYVSPERPQELVNRLNEVKNDKVTLKRWSENARNLSLNVFNKELLTAKVADIIENAYKEKKNR